MENFTFLEVNDKKLLDKVYEFRYKVFMEIYPKYIQKLGLENAREYDKYDEYSVHFAALNEKNEVCATVRFIHHSPMGYPTENNTKFDNSMFKREKLGEMSRVFVEKKYRNIKTTKIIMEAVKEFMYIKMKRERIEYTYASLEENFLRLLKIYKIFYQPVGEKQRHGDFGLRYPCILYTEELGAENPELVKLWEQQKHEK